MARPKDRSPDERDESELIGPFAVPDATGLGVVIPSPLTAGRPKPEPDERWTLGPEHSDPTPNAAADDREEGDSG